MGLRSSKSMHTDLKTGGRFAVSAPQQNTRAQTAASSSQPERGPLHSGAFDQEIQLQPRLGKKVDDIDSSMKKAPSPKKIFLKLDRKRKAPVGLPSLAVNCGGPSSRFSKKYRACDQARPVIQDNGTGHAMVGRRVTRGGRKGRVIGYNLSLKLYQIKYSNGKVEASEWCNLKHWLSESDYEDTSMTHDDTRSSMSRRSIQKNNRWKKVNDIVYGERPIYHKQRRRHSSSRM